MPRFPSILALILLAGCSTAENGGPTQTHAPLAGSPAINAGVASAVIGGTTFSCPGTDQRGVTRPQPPGGACDIGSFEVEAAVLITGLKATVAGLGLPAGTANSLISKLNDALRLANAGKLKPACTLLQDFIKEVTAQTGKKINSADASSLIAAANSIRSVLGC